MVDEDTQVDAISAAQRFAAVDPDDTNEFVEVFELDDEDLEELIETRPLRVRAAGTEIGYREPPLPQVRSLTEEQLDTEAVTDVEERRFDTAEIDTLLVVLEHGRSSD